MPMLRPTVRNHPFLVWALAALILLGLLHAGKVPYDAMPLGILVITDGVWAWMYWIPSEALFRFNDGIAVPFHTSLSVVAGILIAVLADFAVRRIRTSKIGMS
jgi:hypothetical protein